MSMRQLLDSEFVEMSKEQERAEDALLERPKGVSTGQRAIQVLVNQKLPAEFLRGDAMIEPKVGKYATDVIEVGDLFAQQTPDVGTPTEPRRNANGNGAGATVPTLPPAGLDP